MLSFPHDPNAQHCPAPMGASRKRDDISRHESKHSGDPKQGPRPEPKTPDHPTRPDGGPKHEDQVQPKPAPVSVEKIVL